MVVFVIVAVDGGFVGAVERKEGGGGKVVQLFSFPFFLILVERGEREVSEGCPLVMEVVSSYLFFFAYFCYRW